MQIGRRRAGSAVEHKRDRPFPGGSALHRVGGVDNRCRAATVLIEQRERPGGSRVSELLAANIEPVFGDGIGWQQREHAEAGSAFRILRFRTRLRVGYATKANGNKGGEEESAQKLTVHDHHRCNTSPLSNVAGGAKKSIPSCPRRRASRKRCRDSIATGGCYWVPAFAGTTGLSIGN